MVKKTSRKDWQIDNPAKRKPGEPPTLEGLGIPKKRLPADTASGQLFPTKPSAKTKLPTLRPYSINSISAPPRADDNQRVTYNPPPYSYKVGRALSDSRPYFGQLRKRHGLTTDDVISLLGALADLYEDPLYDDGGDRDDEDDRDDDDTHHEPETPPPETPPTPGSARLPEAAPELWKTRDLNLRENAPQFIRRVYAAWLSRGLERRDITRLDPDLYKALSVWLSRHPEDPIVSDLPPQREKLDELIDELSATYPLEDLRKLGHAIDARLRRKQNKS